jgi:flagellar basal body-associated protein FliL
MSEAAEKPEEAKGAVTAKVPIVAIILPGILAAAGGFGAVKLGIAKLANKPADEHAEHHEPPKMPGPTLPLDPFIITTKDTEGKPHALRVTLAVEFEQGTKEEHLKSFVPRFRDTVLSFFRALPLEKATNYEHADEIRKELIEKLEKTGAHGIQRILITDMVVQ